MKTIRRFIRWCLAPIYRFVLPTITVEDPWAILTTWVPLGALGPGSKRRFEWFLEGATTISPKNMEELCDWISECKYIHDLDLFHEADFWQHPKTFEYLRKGDCEDFALWAWRKLIEMDIEATFFIGRVIPNSTWNERHAWVVLSHKGERFIFEPTLKRRHMLQPFHLAKNCYEPHFMVGRDCKPVACEGIIYYMQRSGEARSTTDEKVA